MEVQNLCQEMADGLSGETGAGSPENGPESAKKISALEKEFTRLAA
jgi:hypothetical protein